MLIVYVCEIWIIPKLCPPVPFACKSGGHVPPAPMGAPPMPSHACHDVNSGGHAGKRRWTRRSSYYIFITQHICRLRRQRLITPHTLGHWLSASSDINRSDSQAINGLWPVNTWHTTASYVLVATTDTQTAHSHGSTVERIGFVYTLITSTVMVVYRLNIPLNT